MSRYLSPREYAEIKATRKDWTVTTSTDPISGLTLVTVATEAGWGNAGTRDFNYHVDAIKARVRRMVRKDYPGLRFALVFQRGTYYGDGVISSVTYSAKAV